ncbi:MAG: TonB-dependent receptor [Acidobacteria bacterium]|nr:TonB-dependent receptor [Acidobacteriota bacterium]
MRFPGNITGYALLVSLFLPHAHSQQYTHLSGLIRDPTDAAVPHASITVVSEDTGFRRSAESNGDGAYVVASLQPGLYKITVRKEGFRTVIQLGVKLDVAQPSRVDFILPLGSQQDAITVEGTPAPVHTDDASVGTLVSRDQVERMPLNGRGILSLLELAPGTIVTPATRGEAGQFTANGQRPNMHYFTVDGVSANTGVSGGGSAAQVNGGALPGMTALGSLHNLVPLEALDEFRVQTSTSSPEFGRLPGAQITLSSRSGSNEFHGSVFHYFRHNVFDANDWFANRAGERRAALRMFDYGGSLGGPIRRDRTFFFLSYEGMRLKQPFAWRTPSPTAAVRSGASPGVMAALNLFPVPNGQPLTEGLAEWTGRNNRPASLDTGGLRIDHALTSRVSLFGRYQESPSRNEFGNTQISALDLSSRSVTMGANARLSPRVILDARWNYSRSAADSLWRSATPAANSRCALEPVANQFFGEPGLCDILLRVQIAGVGTAVHGPEPDRQQSQWHILPSAVANFGGHQLRLGADYRRIRTAKQDSARAFSLIADNLRELLTLNQNLWRAAADPVSATALLKEASLFAQDTWRIGSKLTATFGVRWEFAATPEATILGYDTPDLLPPAGFETVWSDQGSNIAPRVGIAFSPRAGSTASRGGFGIYFDSSLSIGTDLVNGGPFTLGQFISARNAPFSTQLRYGFLPGLRLPIIRQWNVSLEHAFRGREVVTASYVGSTGRRLLRREIGADSTDSNQIVVATNHGQSNYHGLQLQYRRKLTHGLQTTASYSWSHSIDDSSSDSSLHWARNGLSALTDRGPSDFDVRHSFSAAATYELNRKGKWALDGIFRARTGFPISVLNSESSLGLTFANIYRPNLIQTVPLWLNDRNIPGGRRLNPAAFEIRPSTQGNLGRNAIYGFGMSQLDLALRREFPFKDQRLLQLRLEAFNLFNQTNFADPIRFLSNPLFGQPPSMLNLMLGTGSPGSGLTPIFQTGGPRSIQLVIRYRF